MKNHGKIMQLIRIKKTKKKGILNIFKLKIINKYKILFL